MDVSLSYPTPQGSTEVPLDKKLSIGRGSSADMRFEDGGLSRLHATVYREDDRVWVVDENSANGSFVNGSRVEGAGTILRNGDSITVGNSTRITVHFRQSEAAAPDAYAASAGGYDAASSPNAKNTVSSSPGGISILPVTMIALALMLFSLTAVFVGIKLFVKPAETEAADIEDTGDIPIRTGKDGSPSPEDTKQNTSSSGTPDPSETIIPDKPQKDGPPPGYTMPAGKKYLDLSDSEKRQYINDRAMKIAQIIGNNSSEAIPPAAVDKIKGFIEGYARRVTAKVKGGCGFGDNLQATYERASKNAPFIIRAFNAKGTDARIGLYLAMIESEHCVCLQSPTGPLGMFQFTFATAKLHFEPNTGIDKGASPSNPDDRCKPEPAARAAASYMKALTGRYGTGPASVPLAIGSYNSGEGGLSANLQKALDSNSALPRDFWTLIEKGDMLSKQFQAENFKYVPKFFAAAIIGENPKDFGLDLQPLSTYNK